MPPRWRDARAGRGRGRRRAGRLGRRDRARRRRASASSSSSASAFRATTSASRCSPRRCRSSTRSARLPRIEAPRLPPQARRHVPVGTPGASRGASGSARIPGGRPYALPGRPRRVRPAAAGERARPRRRGARGARGRARSTRAVRRAGRCARVAADGASVRAHAALPDRRQRPAGAARAPRSGCGASTSSSRTWRSSATSAAPSACRASCANHILSAPPSRDGWFWYIPLHDGTMSVGAVVDVRRWDDVAAADPEATYRGLVARCPPIAERLRSATLVSPGAHHPRLLVRLAARFYGPRLAARRRRRLLHRSGVLDRRPPRLPGRASSARARSRSIAARRRADEPRRSPPTSAAYRGAFERYLRFLYFFYDHNTDPDSYFWTARRLLAHAPGRRSTRAPPSCA